MIGYDVLKLPCFLDFEKDDSHPNQSFEMVLGRYLDGRDKECLKGSRGVRSIEKDSFHSLEKGLNVSVSLSLRLSVSLSF